MATGALHLCRMRISHLPDYPIHSCGVSCCCPSGRPYLRHLRDISTLKGSPPITTDVGINCIKLFFLQKNPPESTISRTNIFSWTLCNFSFDFLSLQIYHSQSAI
uniref:Uncharacterized protein n=1 Tax=Lutzomyia longipalpis TaxID=7200 RepID=A0A1B0CQ45_LUTLO